MLDAFIFLANDQNPLSNITLPQIIGIYTGKIKDIQREIAKLEHDASDKNPDREKAKEAKKKLEEDYKEFRAVYSAINNAQVADLIGPSMKKTSKISLENLVRE